MRFIACAVLLLATTAPPLRAMAMCEPPAAGDVVACGAHVTKPGLYVLGDDLNCPGQFGANITLNGRVTLDLRGHTIRCLDGVGTGVTLLGSRAVLRNGRVTDCADGVVLGPFGDHLVTRVTADATVAFGMNGWSSDRNHLVDNVGRGRIGFAIVGNDNVAFHDTALAPTGYTVSGNANRVTRSTATAATGITVIDGVGNDIARNVLVGDDFGVGLPLVGIDVLAGIGHRVSRNVVHDAVFDVGIRLGTGTDGNDVVRNLSKDARLDLVDESVGCGDNRWDDNLFQTTNQPGCVR